MREYRAQRLSIVIKLAAACLGAAVFLHHGEARAQTCGAGQVYCSAGWCCPGAVGEDVCCNSNAESEGCTTNGECSQTTSNPSNNNDDQSCPDNGVCAGPTCTTTGTGSCELEACVSNDGQTCSYTLGGSAICSASCSNLTACEDQAGAALSTCEGGGSGGCSVAGEASSQTWLSLFAVAFGAVAMRRRRGRRPAVDGAGLAGGQ